ncbi:phenylacetate--CoA ligase [Geothermobacter hydrogeniphilus]|uniref:Phenylacetate-coenzyme A ligase n=1 Tax=Geothermobacter hydrogeniphilus TaxID=1969733 RepID=A0A2K2H702_9BACT|nr:phenylacetate--CoA ligase [Geothermobacter hydrogeniphilus]PNU19027.1 phenylacetate--CoA ligase [Geothermobacter hydrogeniphilus]
MAWSKEETLSRSEMQAIQLAGLQRTVAYVYERNAHYRKKLDDLGVTPDDIRSLDDIRRLPFTTKQDLRDNYPFKMFSASPEEIVEYHATSGTTGKPIAVGYTRQDLEVWSESMARTCTGAGIGKDDVVQNIFGYGLFTGGLGAHYGALKVGAGVIPISGGNTQKQIMLMEDFGSTALTSTPSFLMHIYEVGEQMGVDFKSLNLKSALCGAEPWSESMRHSIQEKFGITVCDIYGLSEITGPGVSFECREEQSGLHINEDFFYPEIIDPDSGEVLPEGEEGELVFTTINKYGQPLLRYRTRDISRLTYGTCSCGRTLVKMARVSGRSDDMLIIRGVNVFPSQIEAVIMKREGVSPHYMVIVERKGVMDSLRVKVEVTEEFMVKAAADVLKGAEFDILEDVAAVRSKVRHLQQDIKDVIGISVEVNLVPPGSIPRSQGKAQRIEDRRPK